MSARRASPSTVSSLSVACMTGLLPSVTSRSSNSSAPGSAPHHRDYVMNCEQRRYYGKYRGIVVNTLDPEHLARLQATVPDVLGTASSTWAMPSLPFAGAHAGVVAVPLVGAGVWIEFEQGDPESDLERLLGGFSVRGPRRSPFRPTRSRSDHTRHPRATYACHLRSSGHSGRYNGAYARRCSHLPE